MRYTELDRRIEALAGRQHCAFSRAQAFDLGATDRFVHSRLAARHWLRAAAGVYVLASSRGTWLRQCKIAELSVENAAIAGRTAAALHGLDGFNRGGIELVAPANSYCRHPFAEVHRYAGAQVTTVQGIRVTTIPQTLCDVASRVGPWRLERALDDALVRRLITIAEMNERMRFYEGSRRPGLPLIRPLVHERGEDGWTPPESELEALMIDVLGRVPSAPRVVRQAALPWRSAATGRVDFLLPDHALIIEADGRRWHTRVADFDRDRWRDNEAVANGYRVLRFTWVHLNHLATEVVDLVNRTVTPGTVAA